MANLLFDDRDIKFVLFDQLGVQKLCEVEKYSEWSQKVLEMLLSEAQKFSEKVLFPLNIDGDKDGIKFENGKVFSIPGTKKAYEDFVEGGWLTPCEEEELGGQGLPHVIMAATHEMFMAANFPFMCYVNLTHDAAKLIELFGNEAQKKLYMEKMYGGEWTGTMCLTEPQAGSDVGALTTKAVRKDDGTFAIEGSKIFITNGEQDVGDNIIHIVLARIEGDAPGTKGLSTFIVPKYCVNDDGSTGDSNNVTCTGIEHKMGLHGSPTTSLSFGDKGECIGYLLGKEQEGIRIMFHMMNSSRLEVGIWGQGISSASYLHALNYSKDRLQGQSLENPDPATQVSITKHPDIRRTLLMMKSYTEGMRAMLYYCSYAMDQEVIAETEEERKNWSKIVSLLIPVCKAYPTEKSVEFALHAIQIYGGYGYTQEYPVEQFLRDSKVACIFEGTTGIQGMDLALRKIGMGKGKVFADFLSGMDEIAEKAKEIPALEKYTDQFMKTKAALAEVPSVFADHAGNGESVYSFLQATPLLEAVGDVMVAWFLLWGAVVAQEKLDGIYAKKGATDDPEKQAKLMKKADIAHLAGKIQSVKFFIGNILPITDGRISAIKWGDLSTWETLDKSFGI